MAKVDRTDEPHVKLIRHPNLISSGCHVLKKLREKLTFSIKRDWNPPVNPLDPGLFDISARGVFTRDDQD